MNDETLSVGRHRIAITHPDKILFPDDGITKADLVDYYRRVAEFALPHWCDRPLSMQRFPDGIGKDGFFQKQIGDYFPDWIDRIELQKEDGRITHVVCNDAATMVYLANQGCITPHLGLSRVDRIDRPDRLIVDLDPSDGDFGKVQAVARATRAMLDECELASFAMTTGSRGLHVVVPLDRESDFDTVREFARDLCRSLAHVLPNLATVEQRKKKRGSRVFLDYLRNGYGQTAVAPYGVRAKAGAPVATPLDWSEALAGDMTPQRYTIANLFRRLGRKADPWAGIGRHGRSLTGARKLLASRPPG
jgi:bifunctional non-homologous end joining protein LigD